MINYNSIFKLKNKCIIINGGLGLLGMEISLACLNGGAKVIILDVDSSKIKNFDKKAINFKTKYKIVNFDTSNYISIEKNYKKLLKNVHRVDVLINCSYPKDSDWVNNSFKKIKLESFRKNIDMHMVSYAWLSKLVADSMIKQKREEV